MELAAVLLIGGEIFRGKDDGVAGEAVAKCVERYPALTCHCDWSAGMGGVLAVDFRAIGGFGRIHKKNVGCFCAGKRAAWGMEPDVVENPEVVDLATGCVRAGATALRRTEPLTAALGPRGNYVKQSWNSSRAASPSFTAALRIGIRVPV